MCRKYRTFTAPHHLKACAQGRPVVMLPLLLYSDDTSGNISKRWNKFDSWCIKLAGLSKKENAKLENIHLLCTSNQVYTYVSTGLMSNACVLLF